MILTAFDGQHVAEDERSLGGLASERAADMILGEGLKGNPLLGSGDGKLALVLGEEALTRGVVDPGHGFRASHRVVEVSLGETV